MYVAHLIKVKGEIEGVRNGECVRRWKGREEKGGASSRIKCRWEFQKEACCVDTKT